MVFDKNVSTGLREKLMSIWSNSRNQQYEKYLSLPPLLGGLKGVLSQKWSECGKSYKHGMKDYPPKEGRKSSLRQWHFLYQHNFCFELESLMEKFWWGQRGEKQKIHWLSWDILCASKFHGGMGHKDLRTFNLALLAKQDWKIMHDQDSLLNRVYNKAR